MNQIPITIKALCRSLIRSRIFTLFNSQCPQRTYVTNTFMAAFPEVIETIIKSPSCSNSPQFAKHYKELIEYTVLKERRFRPSIVMETYKALEKPERFNKDRLHLITMFAWIVELTHSAMITHDDIWDQTQIRGKDIPWHKISDIGLIAINDGVLLYESAFLLMKKYFSSERIYPALVEVLHYMNLVTAMGQYMTWQCKRDGKVVYEHFNMDTYRTIARHKASAALVEGPFKGVLLMTDNVSMLDCLEDIFIELGVTCQIDNDILDIYDKHGNVIKHIGSDIREGTCTFPAVKVLESGNEEMIRIFKQNYGRQELEREKEVIKIYQECRIFEKYCEYLKKTREVMENSVVKMTPPLRRAVLSVIDNVLPGVMK